MKKFGYTLAEVLITMSIIGVVAAITIPTYYSNSENKANASKLASLITSVETAFTSMLTSEAVTEMAETEFVQEPNAENLSKYLKITASAEDIAEVKNDEGEVTTPGSNASDGYYGDSKIVTISNKSADATPDYDIIFETKNGAILFYKNDADGDLIREQASVEALGGSIAEGVGYLSIDVNGPAKPNLLGRDVFSFAVGSDGLLYPAGGLNYSILTKGDATGLWDTAGQDLSCLSGSGNSKGAGCTARLIENNYKIDY